MTTLRQAAVDARAGLAALQARGARRPRNSGWRRLAVAASAFTLALLIFVHSLHPSPWQAVRAACCVLVGGLLSVGLGSLAHWLTDHTAGRSVWMKLAAPILLSVLVVAVNVVVLARLLFTSDRDVQLVLGSLVFGVTVATVVSLPIIRRVGESIGRMELDARRIATGDYSVRLEENGPTEARELSQLAHWYNLMGANVLDASARQQAAEAERRQVITALSHDLRTPLSTIQIMIEAIADGVVSDPATIRRYHETIQAEADHLTDLIGDLFELARLESGTMQLDREALRIEEAIDGSVQAMRGRAAQAQVALVCRIDGALPSVFVDFDRISRVVGNLLQNAAAHTPAGGVIVVRVRAAVDANGEPTVVVQVIDSGDGIAAEALPHIFAATYRGDSSRPRQIGHAGNRDPRPQAGLGLAIAARIVDAHGGHVWAESPLSPEMRELVAACSPNTRPACEAPGAAVSFSLPAWLDRGPARARETESDQEGEGVAGSAARVD